MELTDIPALAHLSAEQLTQLHERGQTRELTVGEELIRHGDQGGKLYFLLEGRVRIYVDRTATRST